MEEWFEMNGMNEMSTKTVTKHLSLHGQNTSLVLELPAGEAPIWRYWGPKLRDESPHGLRESRPLPSFMLDFDQPLTLAPSFGVGSVSYTHLTLPTICSV